MVAPDGAYEAVCEAWWREVQQDAQAEGKAGADRIVEYSFLFDDRLAIWVLTGTGELLGSTTVSTSVDGFRTVGETITAARETMGVRGRDAMVRQAERQSAEDAVQEDASLRQGTVSEAAKVRRVDKIKRDQEVLGAFYQHLLAPVEAHLVGATSSLKDCLLLKCNLEVLIIPHKELFEVPWAALFDSQTGQYLIERCVLRVAPSLRVARTAADALRDINGPEEKEHALVVGNPLPTREAPLCGAEEEAEFVAELLSGEGFEVHALMGQAATKADVQSKIEGARWAHLACHGNFDHHFKGPHILLADLSLLLGTYFILYSRFPR
jgi:CHAT domain-containing protein